MRQTKYIMSGGLAFSEDKDMEKLRQLSLKGWHVSDFKFMGYTLEKRESAEYIYSIDYRSVKKDEEEEYLEFFSSAGWSHIASEANIHLFRALPGTQPIYTDRDTTAEKYKNLSNSMNKLAIPFVLITALAWVAVMISSGSLQSILLGVAVILTGVALPAAWTIITTYSNKWQVEGRKGLVNLVKMLPILTLFIVVILLLYVGGTDADPAINLLSYMIAGATGLPTAIWVIMSLCSRSRKIKFSSK
ncbi:hypothetical protein J14TS2_24470 [Bacillus sp. J14TS2]|uniref:DUF2812 domain-containing protein n=1 Tax=Bacillus sp. J14TS2 TaxID=2807188 RepID=UPI001B0B018A|nr:DUF2812 domain-containing protein [Bacillus sp. J14TS2]GIN71972.1 hypothetical protein J14TS2_24470 [Bacillus sp. J14TS2]